MASLALAVMAGHSSCAGTDNADSPQSNLQPAAQPVLDVTSFGLPEIPADRHSSLVTARTIQGDQYHSSSLNISLVGTDLQLQSSPGSPAWGIWRQQSGAVLLSVEVIATVLPGNSFHIALADYSTGRWEFSAPLDETTQLTLNDSRHRSPAGNCYVAVLASGGDSASIDRLEFTVDALGWQVRTVDSELHVGFYNSLAIINGHPAIAYQAEDALDEGDLKYVRSSGSTGAAAGDWNSFVLVDTPGQTGYSPSLLEVAGHPAICYHDETSESLKYVRSTSASGDSPVDWSEIIVVDNDGMVGNDTSMAIVDGNPAISHYRDISGTEGHLKYARSTTPTGTNAADWSQIVTVDSSARVGWHSSLVVVDGNPAISYYDLTNDVLKYARSTTPSGGELADWSQIVVADSDQYTGNYSSMAVVDGQPAISYYERSGDDLRFIRSTTSTGAMAADWSQKVTVHDTGNVGEYTSLAVISGMPAISYYDVDNSSLRYIRSINATGEDAAAWPVQPETVDDSGNVGASTCLVEIGGRPAISYYDYTNGDLKYAILLD
jgi:hypothetical protein